MIPELLEELNAGLAQAKAAKGESQQLALADLANCARDIRHEHTAQMARLISGGKISKSAATARVETLNRFYHFLHEISNSTESVALRTALETIRKSAV